MVMRIFTGKVTLLELCINGNQPESVMRTAREASQIWRRMPSSRRMDGLRRLQHAVLTFADPLVEAVVHDIKQPPMDALSAEVYPILDALKYYRKRTRHTLRRQHRRRSLLMPFATSYVEYQPYGAVLVISPWNFPLQLSLVPAICALAAGNAVILKPSEQLTEVPKVIEQVLQHADLPKGLVQIATGGPEIGRRLVEARPDKIFFTGREITGRTVARQAAELGIPIDLELSGNSPMVVFADANFKRAAKAAAWGAFFHAGQVCVSVERLYVEASIHDEFVQLIIEETRNLTKYQPLSSDPGDVGPLLLDSDWYRIANAVKAAVAAGATVVYGGVDAGSRPPFFPPTILTGVPDVSDLMETETFGPVLAMTTFTDEAEVIQRINANRFGLNASVFTKDLQRGRRVAGRLDTGSCAVNDVVRNISHMDLPFGGVKASGHGRYRGPEGLYSFTQTKAVMVQRGRRNREVNWFPLQANSIQALRRLIQWVFR